MQPLHVQEQLEEFDAFVADTRARVTLGVTGIDSCLRRGGLTPGSFCVIGGRTQTRKTTVMLNMIAHMLRGQVRVALVGLDESRPAYVGKLVSALSGVSVDHLEEVWDTYDGKQYRQEYEELAENFVLTKGVRPDRSDLDYMLHLAEQRWGAPPQVVFIDYLSLMARDKYAGAEAQRVQRLYEDVQVFTSEQELITIALTQVGRAYEGDGIRNHGHTPLTPEDLKYGGEEIPDVVFSTYRPAKDPLGHMSVDAAKAFLGDKFDQERYDEAVGRVHRYRNSTFLQLTKNRPGVKLHEQGAELVSLGESMRMEEKEDA